MPARTGELTHLDERGRARMVDVTAKASTDRVARAQARLVLAPAVADRLAGGELGGGEALVLAKAAGMLAAKSTPRLVPLCHQILLDGVQLELAVDGGGVTIEATTVAHDRTGVEIEALTACLVAALSLFEACRGEDPLARIEDAVVLEKAGGASGSWRRRDDGSVDHLPVEGPAEGPVVGPGGPPAAGRAVP